MALVARADDGVRRRVDVGHRRALGRDHLAVGRVRLEEVSAAVEFADRVAVRIDERGDEERALISVRHFERTRIRVADGIHERLVERHCASKRRCGRHGRGRREHGYGEGKGEAKGRHQYLRDRRTQRPLSSGHDRCVHSNPRTKEVDLAEDDVIVA